ncbi:MAG: nucleotidyltransferase family protein [Clostridia bacterium]|nr:nucleotidyltransferase family protein [Clostridia bacterium]
MKLGLVLLGAGNSRRFGSNKLLYPVDGQPMGCRALELFAKSRAIRRIYVSQEGYHPLWKRARELGYETVMNPAPERGMASSLVLGLEALLNGEQEAPEGILFGVSDQPNLSEASLATLENTFFENPQRICCLSAQGRRGNPAIFPRALYSELSKLEGDVGGRQVIRQHPELLLPVEALSPRELDDMDERK